MALRYVICTRKVLLITRMCGRFLHDGYNKYSTDGYNIPGRLWLAWVKT